MNRFGRNFRNRTCNVPLARPNRKSLKPRRILSMLENCANLEKSPASKDVCLTNACTTHQNIQKNQCLNEDQENQFVIPAESKLLYEQDSSHDSRASGTSSKTPAHTQLTPVQTDVTHSFDDSGIDSGGSNRSSGTFQPIVTPSKSCLPMNNGEFSTPVTSINASTEEPMNPVRTSTPAVNSAPTPNHTHSSSPVTGTSAPQLSSSTVESASPSTSNNSNSQHVPEISTSSNPSSESNVSDPNEAIYGNYKSKLKGSWIKQQLESCRDGRYILASYERIKRFTTGMRKDVVELIISDELEEDPSKFIAPERFMDLSSAICECFPTERETTFYIPFKKDKRNKKFAARGLLYDKYNYMRKKFKKRGMIVGRKRGRADSGSESDDEAVTQEQLKDINYLQNNAEPHEEIVKFVAKTTKARLHEYRRNNQTPYDYVTTYPAFTTKKGFVYFDVDFEAIYTNKGNNLFSEYKEIENKIINFAKENEKLDQDFAKTLKSLKIDLTNTGDPNDRSLRKLETNVMIPERMRTKARKELCEEFNLAFANCCRDNGGMMVFKCQTETTNLKDCIKRYFFDPQFEKQVTEEYLDERSEYRRTGIGKKYRENMERRNKVAEALAFIKAQEQQKKN